MEITEGPVEYDKMMVDAFDENHERVVPPANTKAWFGHAHDAAKVIVGSDHDWENGVVSDNFIVFVARVGQVASARIDPWHSAQLAAALMKRVHPDLFLTACRELGMGEHASDSGFQVIPVSRVPESAEVEMFKKGNTDGNKK